MDYKILMIGINQLSLKVARHLLGLGAKVHMV